MEFCYPRYVPIEGVYDTCKRGKLKQKIQSALYVDTEPLSFCHESTNKNVMGMYFAKKFQKVIITAAHMA